MAAAKTPADGDALKTGSSLGDDNLSSSSKRFKNVAAWRSDRLPIHCDDGVHIERGCLADSKRGGSDLMLRRDPLILLDRLDRDEP